METLWDCMWNSRWNFHESSGNFTQFHGNSMQYSTRNSTESPWEISHVFFPRNSMGCKTGTAILRNRSKRVTHFARRGSLGRIKYTRYDIFCRKVKRAPEIRPRSRWSSNKRYMYIDIIWCARVAKRTVRFARLCQWFTMPQTGLLQDVWQLLIL